MQKTLIGLLAISILSSFCLNTYHVNASGEEFHDIDLHTLPTFYQSFDTAFYKELIDFVNEKKNDRAFYKNESQALSDKSVALMKLGKAEEAQAILLGLYQENPNEYNFVINLATSYELTGNVDSALILTKKALEINQNSHRGSEWFHVKVLEAKQKMKGHPDWIKKNKVLNIDLPEVTPDSVELMDIIGETMMDIGYQLTERVPFTPQNDILLANIFNEYGDVLAQLSVEMAYVAYVIGEKYDENNVFEMSSKSSRMLQVIKKHKLKVPIIRDFYPDRSKFSLEKKEKMLIVDRKTLDSTFKKSNKIENIVLVLLCLLIAFFGYKFFKKN